MIETGTRELDDFLKPYNMVEIESDWGNHVVELGTILIRIAIKKNLRIIFFNNKKFPIVKKIFYDLEPLIIDFGIPVFLADDINIVTTQLLLLNKSNNSALLLVLPYRRDLFSQIENTHLPKLKYALQIVSEKGWEIIIVNPVVSDYTPLNYYIADITLRIDFKKEGIISVLNKSMTTTI
ncbi:MAG: hypothetical protein J7J82_08340 [Staphylothermus sp.]|nr:hypothetical protein [Staphylothermus sp.]